MLLFVRLCNFFPYFFMLYYSKQCLIFYQFKLITYIQIFLRMKFLQPIIIFTQFLLFHIAIKNILYFDYYYFFLQSLYRRNIRIDSLYYFYYHISLIINNQPLLNYMSKIPSIIRNKIDKSITLTCQKPNYSLIWLHGLGDSSQGFYQYFIHPKSPLYSGARVRLLQAPLRKVTINQGYMFNSWYDIKGLGRFAQNNIKDQDLYSMQQIKQSYNIIDKQVQSQVNYWKQKQTSSLIYPYHRVYLGGFSQGCAMSLYYGLQNKYPLAGLIGYSGYLFNSVNLINKGKIPILLNHGTQDSMIPIKSAQKSYKRIADDSRVTYKSIQYLQHSVTLQQLADMSSWLSQRHSELDQYYRNKK